MVNEVNNGLENIRIAKNVFNLLYLHSFERIVDELTGYHYGSSRSSFHRSTLPKVHLHPIQVRQYYPLTEYTVAVLTKLKFNIRNTYQ